MIDTSDGLSTDLSHICEESGVGAEMDATRIPGARIGKPAREVAFDMAVKLAGNPLDLELQLRGSR